MQIDERIEEAVREAYRGVVAKDGDRMVAAFRGMDDDQIMKAVSYGVFVVGFVINDVFRDGASEKQLQDLAANMVDRMSDWINLGNPAEIAKFMASAARGDASFPGVPREDIIGNTFVVGGYLLLSYRADGQHWWDYLNEIWEALLTAPDPE